MTIPPTVDHQALAKDIVQNAFALGVSSVTSRGYGRSNRVFEVCLSEPTTSVVVSQQRREQSPPPGTVSIPPGTGRLIVRFFRPFDTFNQAVRAENKVTAMALSRSALSPSRLAGVVPRVYGWERGTDDQGNFGWVVEEFMEGKVLADDFPTMPLDKQKIILGQLAEVVKAFQGYELPATVTGYGGCTFDKDGQVVAGPPSFQCKGGPFQTVSVMYTGLLRWQLEACERYDLIKGWRDSSIRDRLDRFMLEGMDIQMSGLPAGRPTLIQGSLELMKTLYDPTTLRLTAILDYGMSHIAIPAVEYLYSFGGISGMLGAPFDPETDRLRQEILAGFPSAVPESKPMRQGPAMFGSGRDIQWGLAKAWDEELARVGALRPSTISQADALARVHWFIQDLAPWHLFDADVLAIRTTEQLQEARAEAETALGMYLESWGY
ncbi:hypothetical protein FE257_004727 [Aspergillus nanangensis]|uniref:Aminoglycoside phosphotransferase domain-containing protein n=1 Tax=Aspergillus nanangensis TaxID=2582783 RepID=A0AAD4D0C2_ASPNN|nr:hypothetical protein FE257_004727 [Aspergillus nanangensis]